MNPRSLELRTLETFRFDTETRAFAFGRQLIRFQVQVASINKNSGTFVSMVPFSRNRRPRYRNVLDEERMDGKIGPV